MAICASSGLVRWLVLTLLTCRAAYSCAAKPPYLRHVPQHVKEFGAMVDVVVLLSLQRAKELIEESFNAIVASLEGPLADSLHTAQQSKAVCTF